MRVAKILVVDDKPENIFTIESLLDRSDIEIVRACSGSAALSSLLDHDVALVLLDVRMPDMTGYEVAELMRGNKKTKHIPIIFVTAQIENRAHVFKGYDSGAVDYLFKPLNAHAFQSKVGVFIDLYHHQEALEAKTKELDQKLAELEEVQQQLEETNQQLLQLSITDSLTGLDNKRQFEDRFQQEWSRAYRSSGVMTLLLVDIDHFKGYNDTYGHSKGDECLQKVALGMRSVVRRDIDVIARVGGEEFAILLPATDADGARFVAEKVRNSIQRLEILHESSSVSEFVTVSVGTATMTPGQKEGKMAMLNVADSALYQAKGAGRNSCRSFPEFLK